IRRAHGVQAERLGSGHALLQTRAECGEAAVLVPPRGLPPPSGEAVEGPRHPPPKDRPGGDGRDPGPGRAPGVGRLPRPGRGGEGYGRVLRQGGRVKRIVEDRDASDAEKKIAEINTSVYCFAAGRLWSALGKVRSDNDQGEYYLTDVIGVLSRAGARVDAVVV